jgi:peptide/nickel transport system permease protein
VQFGLWLARAVRGDLGASLFNRLPVSRTIAQHVGPTAMLSLMAIIVALCIGIPVGIVSDVFRNSWLDQASLVLAMLGAAVPSFWLGLSLIIVFAVNLGWLPSSGFRPPAEGLWTSARHLFLPALALGLPNSALIIRFVRSSLLDVIATDYVRTARAKGLTERVVIFRHAVRNALVPILTVVGLTFAADGRGGRHGDGLQHPRHRPAGGLVGAAARLPGRPGRDADRRHTLCRDQPDGGPAVPARRPARQVLTSDGRAQR